MCQDTSIIAHTSRPPVVDGYLRQSIRYNTITICLSFRWSNC